MFNKNKLKFKIQFDGHNSLAEIATRKLSAFIENFWKTSKFSY